MKIEQKNELAASLNNIMGALQILTPLLTMVKEDIDRRTQSAGRVTKAMDQMFNTPAGMRQTYMTVQTDPATGTILSSDMFFVTADDLAMAEDLLRRVRSQAARGLHLLSSDEAVTEVDSVIPLDEDK